jgi:hypothetical protein
MATAIAVLSLVAGACSSDGESVEDPAPTATTVDSGSQPSLTLDELRQRALDGDGYDEVDLAVTRFALEFGPVDGALDVSFDESLPTTGTDTVNAILSLWDELSAEQQTQVIEAMDRLEARSTLIGSVDGQQDSAVDPGNFASSDPDPAMIPVGLVSFAEAPFNDEEALAIARQASVWLVGKLGGSLNFDLSSAPPSEAERASIDGVTNSLLIPGIGEVRFGTDPDNVRICDITIYTHPHMTGARLKSVIAHEAFHCWTVINGAERTSFLRFPGWLNEGLPTWVGEQYEASSFGARWWRGFFEPETFPLYRATYEAFGYFSQVAQLHGGDDALWAMIGDITAAGPGGDAAAYAATTDGLSPEEIAQLASTTVREPGWGAGWDLSGAGISGDARSVLEQTVSGSDGDLVRSNAGEQRLVRFTLQRPSPDGGPWVVTYDATGLTNNRWADGTEFITTTTTSEAWCLDGTCECPDGSLPAGSLEATPSNADELFVALTGSERGGAAVAMTITSFAELCDGAEPLSTETPNTGGLTGTWKATDTALTAMFESVFVDLLPTDGVDMGVQAVVGEVTMTLASGTGELLYDDVRVFFEPGAALDELVLNGRGTFVWEVADGQLVFDGSTFAMVASSPSLGEFPLVVDETSDLPGGPSTFTFSPPAGQLILAPVGASVGTVWFPTVWVRQD